MEIGGFLGNSTLWYPGNGGGADILTSVDNKNWQKVGKVSSGFSKGICSVNVKETIAKYIKFESGSYLGYGYLGIKEIKK